MKFTNTMSVNDNKAHTNCVLVYPNPTSEKLYVDFPENISGDISVFDISGKEIFSSEIKSKNAENQCK